MTIAASAAGLSAAQAALLQAGTATPPAESTASSQAAAGTTETAGANAIAETSASSGTSSSGDASKGVTSKPRLVTADLPTTIAIGQIGTSIFAAVVQKSTNQVLYTIPPGYLNDLANAGYLSNTGYDLHT